MNFISTIAITITVSIITDYDGGDDGGNDDGDSDDYDGDDDGDDHSGDEINGFCGTLIFRINKLSE